MAYFKSYCDLNYPEATLGAGASMPSAFSGAIQAA
jgi:hypothetical protein